MMIMVLLRLSTLANTVISGLMVIIILILYPSTPLRLS